MSQNTHRGYPLCIGSRKHENKIPIVIVRVIRTVSFILRFLVVAGVFGFRYPQK